MNSGKALALEKSLKGLHIADGSGQGCWPDRKLTCCDARACAGCFCTDGFLEQNMFLRLASCKRAYGNVTSLTLVCCKGVMGQLFS